MWVSRPLYAVSGDSDRGSSDRQASHLDSTLNLEALDLNSVTLEFDLCSLWVASIGNISKRLTISSNPFHPSLDSFCGKSDAMC